MCGEPYIKSRTLENALVYRKFCLSWSKVRKNTFFTKRQVYYKIDYNEINTSKKEKNVKILYELTLKCCMVFSLTFYLAPGSGKGNLKQKSDHLQ